MRIAFIHPKYPTAEGTGATHSATQIVYGLQEAGHEVVIYCQELPEDSEEDLNLRSLSGQSRHPHTNTKLNREIIARSNEFRDFDIVHSYLTPLVPALGSIGLEQDINTVVTLNAYRGTCAKGDLMYKDEKECRNKSRTKCVHCIARSGLSNTEQGYMYNTVSQLFTLRLINYGEQRLNGINAFQALSPHVKNVYQKFGYDPERIAVIPNMLDSQFEVEHASNFEKPFKLLYVGSLQQSKGVDRLPEILSKVNERMDNEVRLTIVGNGGLAEKLKADMKGYGMEDSVRFTGLVPYTELPVIYAHHDLFVYPGRWDEPFGRVFLESLAAGTPVIATDVGSVTSIIGEAGKISEQDVQQFVSDLVSILTPETLASFSNKCKSEIDEYRSSIVIPKFEKLYRDIDR